MTGWNRGLDVRRVRQTAPVLAEQRGYIVAAPFGYRVDGSYGWGLANPPADPQRAVGGLQRADVMPGASAPSSSIQHRRESDLSDGASMVPSARGRSRQSTRHLAALGPISGQGAPATVEKMRNIPQIVVHGDADPTVNVQGSATMVADEGGSVSTSSTSRCPGASMRCGAPNFPAISISSTRTGRQRPIESVAHASADCMRRVLHSC